MDLSIKFCGAARTVTGSMHLLSFDNYKILLDCGLFHGRRQLAYEINSSFSFDPKSINACILSHAHIDHSGNFPTLINKGATSPIFTTPATRELCKYMLPDSGHIQEEDFKYLSKKNKNNNLVLQPLYTINDAEKCLEYFRPLEYHKRFALADFIDLTFFDAGHILGSAITVLELKGVKRNTKIAYAVDLGRNGIPLLRDPEIPKDIDYLIIESTYGAREHSEIKAAEEELSRAINRAIERRGKIIIPSFALERAQLLVYFISELIKKGKVEKIPIYVDSPLTVNLTNVFRENWQYFDDITKRAFLDHHDPLGYDNITYINKVNESKGLNSKKGPMIIISASGMCENGRILHHLKNNIENPNNSIIFAGFMAKNTLGRKIVERESQIKIFGKLYNLKAEVVTLNAFSSHADKNGLVDYVKACGTNLKKVFIVHGEEEQSKIFQDNLKSLGFDAYLPAKSEQVFLNGN